MNHILHEGAQTASLGWIMGVMTVLFNLDEALSRE